MIHWLYNFLLHLYSHLAFLLSHNTSCKHFADYVTCGIFLPYSNMKSGMQMLMILYNHSRSSWNSCACIISLSSHFNLAFSINDHVVLFGRKRAFQSVANSICLWTTIVYIYIVIMYKRMINIFYKNVWILGICV